MTKETRYGKYQYYRKRLTSPDGQQVTIYGKSKAERDAKVDAQKALWAREIDEAESPYVWQYAAQWFETASASMSEDRKAAVRREINQNILPKIGQLRLADVTADDLKAVMASRASMAKATQEKTRQIVRKIFGDAEEAGKIARDPARRLKTAGGMPTAKREALTEKQQQVLLETAENLPVKLFVYLGLYAGLRREEICALKWDCVDLDGPAPTIRVRRACRWIRNNKAEISDVLKSSAAWRDIPIPEILVKELRAAHSASASPWVIHNRKGEPWTYATLRSAWDSVRARSAGSVRRRRKDPRTGQTICLYEEKRLGDRVRNHAASVTIDFEVTPHILRHTYVTRLILGGMDLKRVQYLAGHADPKITLEIYTSLMGHRPEDLIGDVEAIF